MVHRDGAYRRFHRGRNRWFARCLGLNVLFLQLQTVTQLANLTDFAYQFAFAFWILRQGRQIWRRSQAADPSLSTVQRAQDLLAGFRPENAAAYRQVHGTLDDCLTNFDAQFPRSMSGDHALLDNKVRFADVMAAAAVAHVPVLGTFHDGRWSWSEAGAALRDDALAQDGIVVKPINGNRGRGVHVVTTAEELSGDFTEPMLAQPRLLPGGLAAQVAPNSLNAVRLVCFRMDGGPLEIGLALHKFGTRRSGIIDNFTPGGLAAPIDIATGRLGFALGVSPENQILRHTHHPDSGVPIAGCVVESWPAILGLLNCIGRALPTIEYIALDIAATRDGVVVIEGNSGFGTLFYQVFERLRAPTRLAEFLRRNDRKSRIRRRLERIGVPKAILGGAPKPLGPTTSANTGSRGT